MKARQGVNAADPTGWWYALGVVWLLAATGCGEREDVVARPLAALDAGDGDGGAMLDAMLDALPEDAGGVCADAALGAGPGNLEGLVARASTHALCTCEDYSGSANLIVRGTLGVDGAMSQNGDADVRGGLIIADGDGLVLGADVVVAVAGDLSVGGAVLGGGARLEVVGDMAVAGRVQLRELSVGGALRQPTSMPLEVAMGTPPTNRVSGEVSVPPSCPCGSEDRLDLAAVGALHAAALDDGEASVPCGASRLVRDDAAPIALFAPQSASLYLDGDLAVDGDAVIEVADGAVLDLFVAGNVRVDGVLELAPGGGRVRLFVGGDGTLELKGGGFVRGLLHAPDGELVAPAPLAVDGSTLVRRIAASAELDLGPR